MTLHSLAHAARLLDSLGQTDLAQTVREAATKLGSLTKACQDCGAPVSAYGNTKRCPPCARAAVVQYQREYYQTTAKANRRYYAKARTA